MSGRWVCIRIGCEFWTEGACGLISLSVHRQYMVDGQVRTSDVTKYPIISAMLEIPREEFVPMGKRGIAYLGEHIPLGDDRVILDARTLAKMLDCLDIRDDELVLDIGSGYGYSTAIIARMAEAVVSLEEIEGLAEEAERTLPSVSIDNATAVQGPLVEGVARHAPYDVIVIQGGVEQVPQTLIGQLRDGGRIGAIVVHGVAGEFRIGIRHGDSVNWNSAFNAMAPVLHGFAAPRGFVF